MPQIIPIKDLKNTAKMSELCHGSDEPIFITKNGYGDMVIMSMETYEKALYLQNISEKLALAEKQIEERKAIDATASLKELRGKYGV